MNEFGNYIKEQREKRNLTACKFAKLAGLSTTAICRIENGERQTPSVFTIYKLANALDVDIAKLVEIIVTQK